MTGPFYLRKDFDCGVYCNEWSLFIVEPSGSHIGELQFNVNDEKRAEAICAAMNRAVQKATQ